MNQLTISDLNESKELDAQAMSAVMGGHGLHVRYPHLHRGRIRIHWHRGPFGIRIPHVHYRRPRIHIHTAHIRFPW